MRIKCETILLGSRAGHPKMCLIGILMILKTLLKKWPMQRYTLTVLFVSLKAGSKSLRKVSSLPLEVEKHPYRQREGVPSKKATSTNLVTSLTDLPKP